MSKIKINKKSIVSSSMQERKDRSIYNSRDVNDGHLESISFYAAHPNYFCEDTDRAMNIPDNKNTNNKKKKKYSKVHRSFTKTHSKVSGRKLIGFNPNKPITAPSTGNISYFVYLDCDYNHTKILVTKYSGKLAEYLNSLNTSKHKMGGYNNTPQSIVHFAWKNTFISRTAYLGAFTLRKGKDTPVEITKKIKGQIGKFKQSAGRTNLLDNIDSAIIYK